MEHRIGMMVPEPEALRNKIIFDRPTVVLPEHDIYGKATAAEIDENPRLMIGARVVAAVTQALGSGHAQTLRAGSSSYES